MPTPGNELSRIRWADGGGKKTKDRLAGITHEKTPTHANVWYVRLRDLMAIEAKKKVNAKPKKIRWLVERTIVKALNRAKKPIPGIAYVREEAQTLLRLEHGATTVDSLDIVVSGGPLSTRETDEIFEVRCAECG